MVGAAALKAFLLGVVSAAFGWGVLVARALSSLFIGYGSTFVDSITSAA